MIIVRLQGGLGNQMFQYAHGRALALATGRSLWLDPSWFREAASLGHTARLYALGAFEIKARRLPARLCHAAFPDPAYDGRFGLAVATLIPTLREGSGPIGSETLRGRLAIRLDGYWQGERYFAAAAADAIRSDFQLAVSMTPERNAILRCIGGAASVSVHVRRGDYVTHASARAFHGTCPPEWYRAAMNRMADIVPGCRFVVFSDDVPWSRANLPAWPDIIHVDIPDGRDHHIIANSSFSWWGAWLNPSPTKRVIAPKRWFLAREAPEELIPAGWERVG